MSVTVQITLPEPLIEEIKVESKRLNVTVEALIQRTIENRFHVPPPMGSRSGVSFFESIEGLVKSDETDLASRVDEIYD